MLLESRSQVDDATGTQVPEKPRRFTARSLAALLFAFVLCSGFVCHAPAPPPPPVPHVTITASWTYDFSDKIAGFYVGGWDGSKCNFYSFAPAPALSMTFTIPTAPLVFCIESQAIDFDGSPIYSDPAIQTNALRDARGIELKFAHTFPPRKKASV